MGGSIAGRILGGGSSGIVAIIWAADYHERMIDRLLDGALFVVMRGLYLRIAGREICIAVLVSVRHYCTGHMIVGRYKKDRGE